jgi:predicted dinucleotide-binding enzyme
MNIAIIGAGSVGKALALGWARKGHTILFGVRDPRDPKHARLRSGRALTVAAASRSAEIIVAATSWAETENAVCSAGDLTGKILIDCTNPFEKGPDGHRLTIGFDISGGEMVADWARTASVFVQHDERRERGRACNGRLLRFVADDARRGRRSGREAGRARARHLPRV